MGDPEFEAAVAWTYAIYSLSTTIVRNGASSRCCSASWPVATHATIQPAGHEALDVLRGCDPHRGAPRSKLIILDLDLPGMDGCSVLRQIKSDANSRSIPVIMFSLGENHSEISDYYFGQANAYGRKRVNSATTMRAIAAHRGLLVELSLYASDPAHLSCRGIV